MPSSEVYVALLKRVLADALPHHGYFVIRPTTVKAVRQQLADDGELGEWVTFRVVCPECGWRHSWQQYEREPGQFDGLCRTCDTRCNGDSPAVVRAGEEVPDGR